MRIDVGKQFPIDRPTCWILGARLWRLAFVERVGRIHVAGAVQLYFPFDKRLAKLREQRVERIELHHARKSAPRLLLFHSGLGKLLLHQPRHVAAKTLLNGRHA